MNTRRISLADITLGTPLQWDVYDQHNRLLLKRGHVIEREQQIINLVERGIFADTSSAAKKPDAVIVHRELPSVVRLLNDANSRLALLLSAADREAGFQQKILDIVVTITNAVKINPDIALGCILLNQTGSYATRHCVDTAVVALLLSEALRQPPPITTSIMAAALTMNLSMLRYQEQFQKKDTSLSDIERDMISRHPEDTVEQLRAAGVQDENWLECVLMHHENEDGTGYPYGKNGTEIPTSVKILALSDRYCARVSARSYRKSMHPTAALRDILTVDRGIIDPALVATFIRELGTYPTGTWVRLESGEIGMVTGRGASSTTPIVHALVGPRGVPHSFPIQRDVAQKAQSIREVLSPEQANIRFSMTQIWGPAAAS